VKKCQELERKALTIVLNFSKDGAPAPQKKTQMLLLQSPTGACNYWYLHPRKKIAKNQNSTGKSPNCNYRKAPKSAADGKKLKVFRHD
jgi:hypothetical protein